jgi:hypothetical protein
MVRQVLIMLVGLVRTAAAAPPPPLDADLATAQPGDWTIFRGERRTGNTRVPVRMIARVGCPVKIGTAHVVWFEGAAGHERAVSAYVAEPGAALDIAALPVEIDPVEHSIHPAKCTLGAETIDCRLLSYASTASSLRVTTTRRARGPGVVTLETSGGKAELRLTAIGMGRDGTSEWGVPPPDARLVDPAYDAAIGARWRGLGPEPQGPVRGPMTCATPSPTPGSGCLGSLCSKTPKGKGYGLSIPHGGGTGGGNGGLKLPISIGTPTATGALDAAIIRRHVKRKLSRLAYCYDREARTNPTLAGTVTVKFVIDAQGHVASSAGSGMAPAVTSCVVGVIQSIDFPKPASGTVDVVYPLTFQPVAR